MPFNPYRDYTIRINVGTEQQRNIDTMTFKIRASEDLESERLIGDNYIKIKLELFQPDAIMVESKEILLIMRKDKVNFTSF